MQAHITLLSRICGATFLIIISRDCVDRYSHPTSHHTAVAALIMNLNTNTNMISYRDTLLDPMHQNECITAASSKSSDSISHN